MTIKVEWPVIRSIFSTPHSQPCRKVSHSLSLFFSAAPGSISAGSINYHEYSLNRPWDESGRDGCIDRGRRSGEDRWGWKWGEKTVWEQHGIQHIGKCLKDVNNEPHFLDNILGIRCFFYTLDFYTNILMSFGGKFDSERNVTCVYKQFKLNVLILFEESRGGLTTCQCSGQVLADWLSFFHVCEM